MMKDLKGTVASMICLIPRGLIHTVDINMGRHDGVTDVLQISYTIQPRDKELLYSEAPAYSEFKLSSLVKL